MPVMNKSAVYTAVIAQPKNEEKTPSLATPIGSASAIDGKVVKTAYKASETTGYYVAKGVRFAIDSTGSIGAGSVETVKATALGFAAGWKAGWQKA